MAEVAARANRIPLLIGLAIFVLAFGLRLIGIGWGLKNDIHSQTYHPDELVNLSIAQNVDPSHLRFTPHYYNYGTLYFTLMRIVERGVDVYTGGPGDTYDGKWDFASRCLLWGRIVGSMFAAGAACLVFGIMRRFTALWGAALSAAVLAVSPAFVVHSRFMTVDVTATFFIIASAYCALKLIPATALTGEPEITDKMGLKYAALAGLFAGMSAGVKYTGILALFTLFAVLLLTKRPKWLIEALVAIAVSIVTFVATTPGCILDHDKFMEDVSYEMHHVATGHGLAFVDTASGFLYHISNLFIGLGTLLTLCCAAGIIWAAIRKEKWALALLAFALPYYVLIGREEVKFLRYTFPLYLALAAGFGWTIVELHRRGGWARIGVAIGICGLGGIDMGGLCSAATLTLQMAGEEPRDAAIRYIRNIQGPTTRLGMCRDIWYWSVPAVRDNDVPATADRRIHEMEMAGNPPIDIITNPQHTEPIPFSPDLVTKLHPELITFTSIEAANLDRLRGATDLSPADKDTVDRYAAFMTALQKDYKLDRIFGTGGLPVEDMEYINPVVYVWKRIATP